MAYEQKLTADGSQAQKELEKLGQAVDKLTAKNKELAHLAGVAAKNQQGAFSALNKEISSAPGKLRGMALEYISLTKLVGTLGSSYKEWSENMVKAGETHTKVTQGITKDLVQIGHASRAAELMKFFESDPTATKEQSAAAFGGVSATAPGIGLAGQKALSREASQQAVTGIDLLEFGAALGNLKNLAPAKSDNDIADIAVKAQELSGGPISKISDPALIGSMKLIVDSGAASIERVMAVALEAMDKGVDPSKIMKELADEVTKERKEPERKRAAHGLLKPLTEQEQVDSRLFKMTAREKFETLVGDSDRALQEKVLGGTAVQVKKLESAGFTAREQALIQAEKDNAARARADAIREQVPAVAAQHAAEVRADKSATADELRESQVTRFLESLDQQAKARGDSFLTRGIQSWRLKSERFLSPFSQGGNRDGLREMAERARERGVPDEDIRAFREQPGERKITEKIDTLEAMRLKKRAERGQRVSMMSTGVEFQEASGRPEEAQPVREFVAPGPLQHPDAVATNKAYEDRAAMAASLREAVLDRRKFAADTKAGKYVNAPEIQDFGAVPDLTPQQVADTYRTDPPVDVIRERPPVDQIPAGDVIRERPPVDPTPLLREIRDELRRANNNPFQRAAQAPLPDMAGRARREQAMAVP